MNPLEIVGFAHDTGWIVLLKVLFVFVFLLVITIFNVWFERRLVGKMQHRLGPIMNGPLGLAQAVADGAKLIFKEDFRPAGTDRWVFTLAPLLTGVAAFVTWSIIPLAGEVPVPYYNWGGGYWETFYTRLQLTDLPVSVLLYLAIASIGIYGIVLGGWASSSQYSLLGGIRSTAQMISYEISMGLSLVAVFLYAQSMSTSEIVERQAGPILPQLPLIGPMQIPGWYALLLAPSCAIYVMAMVAECNRAPFDLVECEQELVSGFITDYSGFRYAIYFLAEYINMATVSAVATTLFFGGYRAPWPVPALIAAYPQYLGWLDHGWMGLAWFVIKVLLFIALFVWLRGTLPRLRYDQLMNLGWKWLIPISLGWIVLVSVTRYFQIHRPGGLVMLLPLLGLMFFGSLVWYVIERHREMIDHDPDDDRQESRPLDCQPGEFDPLAGGYPVPPLPGQVIPELVGVVRGAAVDQRGPVEQEAGMPEEERG